MSLHFEPDSVGDSLQKMNRAVVGVDDEFAGGPVRVFVSADQKFRGEVFEVEKKPEEAGTDETVPGTLRNDLAIDCRLGEHVAL